LLIELQLLIRIFVQALHQITFLDPESMKVILSTQILPRCTNPELYLRHGSILASGKVISALCQVAKDHQRRLPDELGQLPPFIFLLNYFYNVFSIL
jgi:hypothetical protein